MSLSTTRLENNFINNTHGYKWKEQIMCTKIEYQSQTVLGMIFVRRINKIITIVPETTIFTIKCTSVNVLFFKVDTFIIGWILLEPSVVAFLKCATSEKRHEEYEFRKLRDSYTWVYPTESQRWIG